MQNPVAIILAAGKSTRMKSALPKVLHEVCGRPMIEYVLDAARGAGVTRIIAIVGHCADEVQRRLAHHSDVEFALQSEQKGTGHAVMMAQPLLAAHQGPVLVLAGDTPLLTGPSLAALIDQQRQHHAAAVIGTAVTANNQGLGRIVRGPAGRFERIVEERDATPQERTIQEINTGCYAFDTQLLLASLQSLQPNNSQGEYYLTDCPAQMLQSGKTVLAQNSFQIEEALGVNTRAQLAEVTRSLHDRHLMHLMTNGVTITSPERTFIDPQATIANDTTILPFTCILGPVTIGSHCRIGPHATLQGPLNIAEGTTIGPFETR